MLVVILRRGDESTPWGFRLYGGKDFGIPLSVQKVNAGSVAYMSGLREGDVILKVGETSAAQLRHKDAQDLIRLADNTIELTVKRPGAEEVQSAGRFESAAPSSQPAGPPSSPPAFTPTNSVLPKPYTPAYDATVTPKPFMASGFDGSTSATPKPNTAHSTDSSHSQPSSSYSQPGSTYSPLVDKLTQGMVNVDIGSSAVQESGQPKPKTYTPSATYQLIRDQELGKDAPINPRTGKEMREPIQSKLVSMIEKKCAEMPSSSVGYQNPAAAKTFSTPPNSMPGSVRPGQSGVRPVATPSSQPRQATPPSQSRPMSGNIEQAKSMPAAVGAAIPSCNVCHKAIRGPYVVALNKTWCPEHFVCTNPSCQRSLVDCGFVEEDGQLFCDRDYALYFAPRCSKCELAITGEVLNAMQKTFHLQCFVCKHCGKPIVGSSFHLDQGEPYCDKDWTALFQTKCYGCQYPIDPGDTWIQALDQNWHSNCFVCTTCRTQLEGQPFFKKAGRPYCKTHAN